MIEFLRERWSVTVIALGAVLGVWFFLTLPAIEAWRDAEARRQSAELDLAAIERQTPENGASAEEARRVLALRFGGDGINATQDRAHELAERSGASIVRLSASGQADGTSVGPVRVVREGLTIEAVGTFESIARFLSAVRDAPMAAVESFSVTPPSEGDRVRLRMTVRTLRLERASRMVADGGVE
jgi:hypothetical protein